MLPGSMYRADSDFPDASNPEHWPYFTRKILFCQFFWMKPVEVVIFMILSVKNLNIPKTSLIWLVSDNSEHHVPASTMLTEL